MGCDIHIYTEIKMTVDGREQWGIPDPGKLKQYCRESEGQQQHQVDEVYSGRNYRLFSILADVKNDSGVTPICDPKGLPDDACPEVVEAAERMEDYGHSYSYLTLEELKDYYEEHPVATHSGMMSPENAEKVDNGEMPISWCRRSMNETYVYREWEWKDESLADLIASLESRSLMFYVDDEDIRIVFWFDS